MLLLRARLKLRLQPRPVSRVPTLPDEDERKNADAAY